MCIRYRVITNYNGRSAVVRRPQLNNSCICCVRSSDLSKAPEQLLNGPRGSVVLSTAVLNDIEIPTFQPKWKYEHLQLMIYWMDLVRQCWCDVAVKPCCCWWQSYFSTGIPDWIKTLRGKTETAVQSFTMIIIAVLLCACTSDIHDLLDCVTFVISSFIFKATACVT